MTTPERTVGVIDDDRSVREAAEDLLPSFGVHVFMTGDIDIPSSIRAMKDSAVDVLVKPFSEEQPLSAINYALQQTREATRQRVGPSSSADDSPQTRLR